MTALRTFLKKTRSFHQRKRGKYTYIRCKKRIPVAQNKKKNHRNQQSGKNRQQKDECIIIAPEKIYACQCQKKQAAEEDPQQNDLKRSKHNQIRAHPPVMLEPFLQQISDPLRMTFQLFMAPLTPLAGDCREIIDLFPVQFPDVISVNSLPRLIGLPGIFLCIQRLIGCHENFGKRKKGAFEGLAPRGEGV